MTSGITRAIQSIEETVNRYGYFLLSEYLDGNARRVIIKDKIGYKYDIILSSLMRGTTPDFVNKRNNFSLENISFWLRLNKKEFELCENNIYIGSHDELLFHCLNPPCNRVFHLSWNYVFQGNECPYCRCLENMRPDLICEWSHKNNFDPDTVLLYSNKKVIWVWLRM